MYIKINSTGQYAGGNSGSCQNLVEYLEKENEDVKLGSREMFFNQDSNNVSSYEVQHKIDNNKQKLTAKEDKFYMLSINPSQRELQHLAQISTGRNIKSTSEMNTQEREAYKNLLKDYTKNIMDKYAKSFNRGLSGKDILFYGKVEHARKYSRDDKLVKENRELLKQIDSEESKAIKAILHKKLHRDPGTKEVIKAGKAKGGLQEHVHVIISRKSKDGKMKLSPLANSRGSKNKLNGKDVQVGFNRSNFYEQAQKDFDNKFNYLRGVKETYQYRNFMKNHVAKGLVSQGIHSLGSKELSQFTSAAMKVTDYAMSTAVNAEKLPSKVVKDISRSFVGNIKNEEIKILTEKAKMVSSVVRIAATAVAAPQKLPLELAKKGFKIVQNL